MSGSTPPEDEFTTDADDMASPQENNSREQMHHDDSDGRKYMLNADSGGSVAAHLSLDPTFAGLDRALQSVRTGPNLALNSAKNKSRSLAQPEHDPTTLSEKSRPILAKPVYPTAGHRGYPRGGKYPCPRHNPDNPNNDPRPECRFLKEYPSQLVPHLGIPDDDHSFYPCRKCGLDFASDEALQEHKSSGGCIFRCVTENCENFHGTLPYRSPCRHGSKNSRRAIWREWTRNMRHSEPGPSEPYPESVSSLRSPTIVLPSLPPGQGNGQPSQDDDLGQTPGVELDEEGYRQAVRPHQPPNQDLMHCHQCEREWFRDDQGFLCPECQSDLTEISEPLPDQIQRIIESLAAEIRTGSREGSIVTTYDDDEKEVWKQFRRELIGEGMKSSFVHKYEPQIRRYLKTLAQKGLMEEGLSKETVSSQNKPIWTLGHDLHPGDRNISSPPVSSGNLQSVTSGGAIGDSDEESNYSDSGFSVNSVASSMSSIHSIEITHTLVQKCASALFCNVELGSINASALHDLDIGSDRFERKVRRLIAKYGTALIAECNGKSEREAAKLFHSTKVSSKVAHEALVQTKQQQALKRRRMQRTSYHEEESSQPKLADIDQEGGFPDDDFEDEDEDEAFEPDLVEQSFKNLQEFLLKSEAYACYKSQLLEFAHNPYETRIKVSVGQSPIFWSGTKLSPEAIMALNKEIAWIPPSEIHFIAQDLLRPLDHVQAWIEGKMGETWDWWPLCQRKHRLIEGYTRVSWQSVSECIRQD